MRIISEKNYVDQAEKVMKELKQNGKEKKGKERSKNGDKEIRITTSKIRNILSMTINILNEVKEQRGEILPDSIMGQISYLKVRILYEAGRDRDVKEFVEKGNLVEIIESIEDKKSQKDEKIFVICGVVGFIPLHLCTKVRLCRYRLHFEQCT